MWLRSRVGSVVWRAGPQSIHKRWLTADGRRLVLGIESSCDDSCAALVSAAIEYPDGRRGGNRAVVHTSIVHKQDHGLTRGIEPLMAANSHSAKLPHVIRTALQDGQEQGIIKDSTHPVEVDAIAVTQGPGMPGCLTQGLSMAKLLSTLWDRPLMYVHHMVAHTLTPLLTENDGDAVRPIRLPFLVMLLSGGHTQLVLCESFSDFRILASTTDNSIGDAIDKATRTLKIPFDWSRTSPGAAMESFARQCSAEEADSFLFPVSVRGRAEFSYSGLISAASRLVDRETEIYHDQRRLRAAAFAYQQAAFAQVQDKVTMALDKADAFDVKASQITDLIVSGGVASNSFLRGALRQTLAKIDRTDVSIHFPPIWLCTDNAAMIAHAALVRWQPTHDLTAKPRAKWSMEEYP